MFDIVKLWLRFGCLSVWYSTIILVTFSVTVVGWGTAAELNNPLMQTSLTTNQRPNFAKWSVLCCYAGPQPCVHVMLYLHASVEKCCFPLYRWTKVKEVLAIPKEKLRSQAASRWENQAIWDWSTREDSGSTSGWRRTSGMLREWSCVRSMASTLQITAVTKESVKPTYRWLMAVCCL